MISHIPLIVVAVQFCYSVEIVSAFSGFAGGCDGGQAAVGGLHIVDDATTGTLETGGFSVMLDDTIKLVDEGCPQVVDPGMYTLSIVADDPTSQQFRGFLIRLGDPFRVDVGVDNIAALEPIDETVSDVANACDASMPSMTHTSSDWKSSVSGTLVISDPGTVRFDVTVVVANAGNSEYYYSGYAVQFLESASSSSSPSSSFLGSIFSVLGNILNVLFGWLL